MDSFLEQRQRGLSWALKNAVEEVASVDVSRKSGLYGREHLPFVSTVVEWMLKGSTDKTLLRKLIGGNEFSRRYWVGTCEAAPKPFGIRACCFSCDVTNGESSARLREAELRPSGQHVAVKQVFLSKLNPRLKSSLDCEINLLSSVNQANIVHLLHFFQGDGCVYLVLEFCTGGSLASYIQYHGRVRQLTATIFMQQLGSGVKVLHSHGIICRDLKPGVKLKCTFS
ncbi:hypothetical protein KIW84_052020 [Lathyrus oleraceus]|uniref:Protein kinase domain-containing protein n=1 Tax=Pisum sativum TaxID=3888 RepID=A0A9D5AED4_PEA|nr:hypothetical protein KIW84_052020 [Pisum sativum]